MQGMNYDYETYLCYNRLGIGSINGRINALVIQLQQTFSLRSAGTKLIVLNVNPDTCSGDDFGETPDSAL